MNHTYPKNKEECETALEETKDKDGRWYWWGQWNGSNKEECWCYGAIDQKTEGWITVDSQDVDDGRLCQKTEAGCVVFESLGGAAKLKPGQGVWPGQKELTKYHPKSPPNVTCGQNTRIWWGWP